MHSWQIGSFTVTEVPEFPIAVGLLDGLIAEATPEVVQGIDWMTPDFATEQGQTTWDIHCYVVDTGEHVILVDPGVGNGKSIPLQPTWSGLDNPFLDRLREAGYGPQDVDIILSTHLHLDHIGWCTVQNADGSWVPTFPNARLVLVKDEYDHHRDLMTAPQDAPSTAVVYHGSDPSVSRQTQLVWAETMQPIEDAGQLELVAADAEVVPGVRYESSRGHTAGHSSVRLESGGDAAFITGDFIHHPVQIARPDWSSRGDWNPEDSARNRREFFESCAGTDLLILGTHFTGRGAGYIVADGDGFRLTATASA